MFPQAAENLRGAPYLLPLEEITRRTAEAWQRGATEVCMQVIASFWRTWEVKQQSLLLANSWVSAGVCREDMVSVADCLPSVAMQLVSEPGGLSCWLRHPAVMSLL